MASINQVNVLGTVYDIEDASAQQSITAIQGDIAEITTDLGNKAPLIEPTTDTADVATFADGAAGMPMEVTVTLDPIQAGSGDPAPDNVREISGRTGIWVYRAVENLLEITLETQTISGVTFTNNGDGSIHVSGTASAQVYLAVGATDELVEDSYVWAGNPAGASGTTYFMTRNNGSGNFYNEVGNPYTASGVQTPRIYVRNGVSLDVVFRPQIIRASELESLSVTFPDPPGTVYGGTLTVNRDGTGKLVVDRRFVDLTNIIFTESSTTGLGRFIFSIVSQGYPRIDNSVGIFCSHFKPVGSLTTSLTNVAYVNRTQVFIQTGNPSDTVETFTAYLAEQSAAGTPVTLCYRLETPITYDLTAEQVGQITSAYGLNNVWSAGQVTVTYAADTKLYIDGKIASLQATILENISNA